MKKQHYAKAQQQRALREAAQKPKSDWSPTTLATLWQAYTDKNPNAIQLCAETLAKSGGIDVLHIAGLLLMEADQTDRGINLLRAAIEFQPKAVHIYTNSAFAAEKANKIDDMVAFTDAGLIHYPRDPDLLLLKGNSLMHLCQFGHARDRYNQLLRLDQKHVRAWVNLGNAFRALDDIKQADYCFEHAELLDPNNYDLMIGRATMYAQIGESAKTLALLEPLRDDPNARFLLAMAYLAEGDYIQGFDLYRSRGGSVWYNSPAPMQPMDHYTEATGKNIAVIQEGGLGDFLMLMRYLPMLARIATSITLLVPSTLNRLALHNLPDNIVVTNEIAPTDGPFDFVTTDMEMPWHFRTTVSSIPTDVIPYINVPDAVRDEYASLITPIGNGIVKRVGLCWAGGGRQSLNERQYDERRSLKFADFDGFAHPAIQFVSLQYGAEEGTPSLPATFDMFDTAAIIAHLDLVITVDTSIVHLAAAMGKETWLLSRQDCCWRWLHNQPQSPWYPNVRVFGQSHYRDWTQPLQDCRDALHALVAGQNRLDESA